MTESLTAVEIWSVKRTMQRSATKDFPRRKVMGKRVFGVTARRLMVHNQTQMDTGGQSETSATAFSLQGKYLSLKTQHSVCYTWGTDD